MAYFRNLIHLINKFRIRFSMRSFYKIKQYKKVNKFDEFSYKADIST